MNSLIPVLLLLASAAADSESAAVAPSTSVDISRHGLSIKSADGAYGAELRGWVQLAARSYLGQDEESPAGVNDIFFRRLRADLRLSAAPNLTFRMHPELSGNRISLLDVYVDFSPSSLIRARAGIMKTPFGFELLQAPMAIPFLEHGLATRLVPNRDFGLMLFGSLGKGLLGYQVGVFNGVLDGSSSSGRDISSAKDFAGRLFVRPFAGSELAFLSGLGLGVAGTFGREDGSVDTPALASYATAGRQRFFGYRADLIEDAVVIADGTRMRGTGQLFYHFQGLAMLGEYVAAIHEVRLGDETQNLMHQAWGAQANYAIGGVIGPRGGVRPKRDFDILGGPGALELKARAGQLLIDSATFPTFATGRSMSKSTELSVGVNWWLTTHTRLMLDYCHSVFDVPDERSAMPAEQALIGTLQFGLF